MQNIRCLASLFLLWLLASTTEGHEHTICAKLSDSITHECSANTPVCCVWPNGLFIACCPAGATCDLFRGTCALGTAENKTKLGSSRKSEDDDDGTIYDTKQPQGIEVTLQTAATFFGMIFVSFLLAINFSARLGMDMAIQAENDAMMHALEQREILVAAGEEDSSSDEEAPVAQPQEEAMLEQRAPSDSGDTDDGNRDGDRAQLLPVPAPEPPRTEAQDDIDDATRCKICYARATNSVLAPCGHVACCTKCARKLAACPLCRQPVQTIIKLTNAKDILAALSQTEENSETHTSPATGPSVPQPNNETLVVATANEAVSESNQNTGELPPTVIEVAPVPASPTEPAAAAPAE